MGVRKHWWIINFIALFFAIVQAAIYDTAPVQRLELSVTDTWFKIRGALASPREVAVAAIDDETLDHLGLSPIQPLPREMHAALLQRARDAGVKGVVFDLLFQGQGPNPYADFELAESLTLLPTAIAGDTVAGMSPSPVFASRATALGSFLNIPDLGKLRRFPPSLTRPGMPLPSLSALAARFYGVKDGNKPGINDMVNYYGPAGTILAVPYYRLLDPADPALSQIKDRILFVGTYKKVSSPILSIEDSFFTPFDDTRTFGVEVHATMAANLIRSDWIRRADQADEKLALTLAVVAMAVLMLSLKPYWSFLILIITGGAWTLSSYVLFLRNMFLPGISAVLLVLPAIFLCGTLYYYFRIYFSQRRIRRAFSCYLSPEMVNTITESERQPELGGALSEVTLLFSDIAGFTSWVEKNSPQEVCARANEYFTQTSKPVLDSGGTLIKFIGDGIFALWGAPVEVENARDAAVQSALDIQQIVAALSNGGGAPHFHTRIGIHYGPVVVGNFGSAERFDYTALGDAVNLCSRLEQLNKRFGTSILLSDAVMQGLVKPFNQVPLGLVQVVGRKNALQIATVLQTPLPEEIKSLWLEALRAFSQRRWNDAEALFSEAGIKANDLKSPAALYLSFLAAYRARDLGDTWQGELAFEIK